MATKWDSSKARLVHKPAKTYSGAGIAAAIETQAGPEALMGTIDDLAIVFLDGVGSVHLDNIRVNEDYWTSAADNGN